MDSVSLRIDAGDEVLESKARRPKVGGAQSALLRGDDGAVGRCIRRRSRCFYLHLAVELVKLLLFQHRVTIALQWVEHGLEAPLCSILGCLFILLQLLAHII